MICSIQKSFINNNNNLLKMTKLVLLCNEKCYTVTSVHIYFL